MAPVDAVLYHPGLVDSEGVLSYRRHKTGELAVVPLPEHLRMLLRDIPLEQDIVGPNMPFRSTTCNLVNDTHKWGQRYLALFKLAGITEVKTDLDTLLNGSIAKQLRVLLEQRGVRFRTGMVCGRDLKLGELRRDFDALFFGLGRANPVKLDVPGAKLRGVRQAYPFVLRNTSNVALESAPVFVRNRRVVVLGGGETAVDALRVAIRCGASDAACLYRRETCDMSARPMEIESAEEEGARFLNFTQAVRVIGNSEGDVTHVRCVRTVPGNRDASGRCSVSPVPGSEFDVPADVVLVAYGFEPPKLTQMDEFSELAFDDRGFLRAIAMAVLAGILFYTVIIAVVAFVAPWRELTGEKFMTAVAFQRAVGSR